MSKFEFIEEISAEGYYHVYGDGHWNIGIYPVLFGNRIRIWEKGSQVSVTDTCCGPTAKVLNSIYNQLLIYLNDGGDPRKIPHQTRRPFPQEGEQFTEWMEEHWDISPEPYEVEITEEMLEGYRRHHMTEFVDKVKSEQPNT